jgi:hypothetical protein
VLLLHESGFYIGNTFIVLFLIQNCGDGFTSIEHLGGIHFLIQKDELVLAAALERAFTVPYIREIVLERCEQEGTKLAPVAIRLRGSLALQEKGKEILDEVLGIGRRVTTPADKAVERRPIIAAELSQFGVGRGG